MNVFIPYRLCLLGAHTDHQGGQMLGIALNKGIHINYKESDIFTLTSNIDNKAHYITDYQMNNHYTDYFKATIHCLSDRYGDLTPVCVNIKGDYKAGGISSSAATIFGYILSILNVNHMQGSYEHIVNLEYTIEHDYLNVHIGKLDPIMEMFCKDDGILLYDAYTQKMTNIKSDILNNCSVMYISGEDRCLVNSSYNKRVDECKQLANSYGCNILREVKDLHSTNNKRGLHFISEFERVNQGIECIKNNNIESLGKLMTLSGDSSICNYECGSEKLIELHNILKNKDYVYGTRFNGAGFNGSSMALIKKGYEYKLQEDLKDYIVEQVYSSKGLKQLMEEKQ